MDGQTVLQARKIILEAEAVVDGRTLVPWIFTNRAGHPLDAMNFLHRLWGPLLDKAGLRRIWSTTSGTPTPAS